LRTIKIKKQKKKTNVMQLNTMEIRQRNIHDETKK
jgi:hypothetical protein